MSDLETYNLKRDFDRTPEPRGESGARSGQTFVVQKHDATRLHYDVRLEHGGVLWSWAVPKGPSLDPAVKRLAMRTEDHPVSYADFEGVIPRGEYGGGPVLLWDTGTWEPLGDPERDLERGRLKFRLDGEKLAGTWILIRTHRGERGRESWLLRKLDDEVAAPGAEDIVDLRPESVATGRDIEEIARSAERVWHGKDSERASGAPRPDPREVDGARAAPLPAAREISVQLATLSSEVPSGSEWIHELKLDGYRIVTRIDGDDIALLTRRGNEWNASMPSVERALRHLDLGPAILDGEVVVFDRDGKTDFQLLQNSMSEGRDAALRYVIFDLLYLGGCDLRGVPQLVRKRLLRELLSSVASLDGKIRYGDHVEGRGQAFFDGACSMGAEGVISKLASAVYRGGRGRSWVKIKCLMRQEAVVVGWTEPKGSRSHFGALLLGLYRDGELHYAGKVGTGFSEASLRELHQRLIPLERERPAPIDPPRGASARGAHWIEPELVAEISATELTRDGKLRQPVFHGLRDDKDPHEVGPERPRRQPEAPAPSPPSLEPRGRTRRDKPTLELDDHALAVLRNVRLTNPERILYPTIGITKKALALYYAQVAPWILPHLKQRPLTLVRCPEGQGGECFYQKHAKKGTPESWGRVPIEDSGGVSDYVYVDDLEGLMAVPQMGVLELHPWGARIDDLERPDLITLDLDPAPELSWHQVVEGALLVRERLAALGLQSFVKTTGGKGLHVVAPLTRRTDWDLTKSWTRAFAESIARAQPSRYLAVSTKAKRTGKIFIDYLRNGRGATAVAPYSTRARPGARVATPLTWDELEAGAEPDDFDVDTVPRRLRDLDGDPWAGFFQLRQSITVKMRRQLGVD